MLESDGKGFFFHIVLVMNAGKFLWSDGKGFHGI